MATAGRPEDTDEEESSVSSTGAGAVLGFAVVLLAFAFAQSTLRHEWTFWIAVLVLFVAPNFYAQFGER